jgi:hypothetical protein
MNTTTKELVHDYGPDNETLHSFVLRNQLGGGDATNTLNVATSMLVTPVISTLDCHFEVFLIQIKIEGNVWLSGDEEVI